MKDKKVELIDSKDIGKFPLTFQYIEPIIQTANKRKSGRIEKEKLVPMPFYQTNQFKTYTLYKPISKIILTSK